MIKQFQVFPDSVTNGVGRQSGKPYRQQAVYAHLDNEPVPVKVSVFLREGDVELPTGFYKLKPESVYVDSRGNLSIRPEFERIQEPKTAPKAAA